MFATGFYRAWHNIREDTSAAVSGIVTTSVSLVILGSIVLIYLNLITLTQVMFQQSRYSVFVESDTDNVVRSRIINKLKSIAGVYGIQMVPAEDAEKEMRESFGEAGSVLENITLPPFPDIIEFSLDRLSILTPTEIAEIQSIDGVAELVSGIETKDQIATFFTISEFVGLFLIILLIISIVLMIHSAIQIAVRMRMEEIEILKILGATATFIRIPFMIEGVFIASLGYLISLAVIYLLYTFVVAGITFNEATYGIKEMARFFSLAQMGFIFIFILILGFFSSLLATNKVFLELKA